jgi:hypothetical protein
LNKLNYNILKKIDPAKFFDKPKVDSQLFSINPRGAASKLAKKLEESPRTFGSTQPRPAFSLITLAIANFLILHILFFMYPVPDAIIAL